MSRLIGWAQGPGAAMARGYKAKKRGGPGGKFVALPEWLQASAAWATLPPGPRALYVELKRRFTGSNNGQIFLSHRDAAAALAVHRNTVGPWFRELETRGFIRLTVGPHLGPSGIGQASVWELEELGTSDGMLATKSFMRWQPEKQNPRTKSVPPRHKKQDGAGKTKPREGATVLNFVTPSAENRKGAAQCL